MKHLIVLSMLIAAGGGLLAQSRKTIRTEGISSITVNEVFVGEGRTDPAIESYESFNEDGEPTEIREYAKSGELKRWERFVYDEEGRLSEKTVLDERGRIQSREKTFYTGKLRSEKHYFDRHNRLVKKKIYVYEYREQD